MKWTFHPTNKELTTSLPMSIELEQVQGEPRVILSGVGELELKQTKPGFYRSDFYVTLPGTYELTMTDRLVSEKHVIQVEQHTYLDFQNEFGFFFILFLAVMGGIILWTRKIMKKKTA